MTTIRNNCNCCFEERYISGDILLCNDITLTNVVYKANITAYGSISSKQLKQWITNISCYTQYGGNNGSICLQTFSSSVSTTNTASPSVTSTSTEDAQANFHSILIISILIPMFILLLVLVWICVVVSILLRRSANKKDR